MGGCLEVVMGAGPTGGIQWCFGSSWDFDGGAGVLLSVSTSMLLCLLSLGSGLGTQYHS